MSMSGSSVNLSDGVHARVGREEMPAHVRKFWDAYELVPGAALYHREFGFMEGVMEAWVEQGMPRDANHPELFGYDHCAKHSLGQLGWCEAHFSPFFKEEVLEDRGEHELARDYAGRHVLYFKGRRNGFMPEYVDHPVKGRKTWEEDVKWRMDPSSPSRYENLSERMEQAKAAAAEGQMICQNLIGGYMYLRSLIGPEDLLYFFYDEAELLHDCMQTWLTLADAVIARHQEHVTIDEFFLAEDICYNCGPLISPDMMREFLLPYYQQLLNNIRNRQIDKTRHIYVQVDTDGKAMPTIPVYQEIGMDVMSPFEVASGCDVVAVGEEYPGLVLCGGIDKRVLAQGKDAIDRMLERIIPPLRARGGYIPTCDHTVPMEVSYQDYLHYRRRLVELGG